MEVSNYIKMRDQMQERFLTYDQKEIEGKYGFAFDDDYFYVPYLFEEWRVNRHTGVVEGSKDHFLHVHQGSFNETLTIFDLLCCGKKEIVLAGTYARTNSLKGTIKGRTIASGVHDSRAARYDGHVEQLKKACVSLSGKPYSPGDAAFVFHVFPFLPLVFSAVILAFAGKAINQEKHVMIPRKTYEALTDSKIAAAIREIRAEDPGWYRMEQYGDGGQNLANVNWIWDIGQNVSTIYSSAYNAEYKKFRDETYGINEAFRNRMMQTVSDDPLFWQLMGVKYILAETRPEGYELYRDYGDFQVYRAISAAPVAYVTDQVVSETEYKSLPYPQNQEILETAAVIPDQEMRKTTAAITDQEKSAKSVDNFRAAADSDTKNGSVGPLFHSCFQKVNLEIPETDQEDLRIQKTADGYEIETKKSVTVSATLPGAAEGATLLAVSFEVENQKASHDMFIRINGQTNRLTGINHTYANGNTQFNYLVTMKEDGTVFIRMGKGHYILKNFETWTGMAQPLEKTEQLYSQAVTLIGGTTATYGGDGITGVVSAERDGYLITSIPYDENFVLKVDGKETLLFRANTAFLGAKIPSGEHKIVLVYHAPGRTAGSWCSLMGGMLALILVICEKKKQQNGSERAGESKMLQKQRKYYIIRV